LAAYTFKLDLTRQVWRNISGNLLHFLPIDWLYYYITVFPFWTARFKFIFDYSGCVLSNWKSMHGA